MSDNKIGPGTYLTDAEAREFHKGFVVSMAFFVIVAVIAPLAGLGLAPLVRFEASVCGRGNPPDPAG